jgi:hypothetical protein
MKIQPILENIEKYFSDYLNLKHWVLWKYEYPPDTTPEDIEKASVLGRKIKLIKRPKNPNTGKNASTSAPETWGTYWHAKKLYLENPGVYDGFGITQKDLGMVNFDLDHIFLNGHLKPAAQNIIDIINSYTEITPSSDGCRIYTKGVWFKGKDSAIAKGDNDGEDQKVEVFGDGNFYVTITGKFINDPNRLIINREKETKDVWELINPPKEKKISGETDLSIQNALDNTGTEYKIEPDAHYLDMTGTKFKVFCPWGDMHESGRNDLGDAFIFLPDAEKMPWFHCMHNGCKEDGKKGIREYYIKAFGYAFSRRNLSEEIDDLILANEGMEFNTLWLDKELCIFSKTDKNNRSHHLNRLRKRRLIDKHPTKADEFRVKVAIKRGSLIGTPTPPEIKVNLPLNLNNYIQVHSEDLNMFGGVTGTGKTAIAFHLVYLNYGIIPIVCMVNGEITQYQKDSRTEYFLGDHPVEYWTDRDKWDWVNVDPPSRFHDFIPLYHNSLIICDYFNESKQYEAGMYMNEIYRSMKETGNIVVVFNQLHEGKDEFNSKVFGGDQVIFPVSNFIKLTKSRFPDEFVATLSKVRTFQPGKECTGLSCRYKITENRGKVEISDDWDVYSKASSIKEAEEFMMKKAIEKQTKGGG